MDGRRRRAVGASLFTIAALALAAAPAAWAAPGVSVSEISSLKAGASSGTLSGKVINDTSKLTHARVTISLHRRGTARQVVGRTAATVAGRGSANFTVAVKLPSSLKKGTYYLSACTPSGNVLGGYRCATARDDILIGGGAAVRGMGARAKVSQAAECSSGARTLSKPGMRVYPETGNGGYTSTHTDVFLNYDAPSNLFLPGTHVDLTQKATQCLTDFSVDFERTNGVTGSSPGPDMQITSVAINGQPATFEFKQPTYPGDPNGQDDPDPLAHRTGLTIPINAANPNPPACAPTGSGATLQNLPCPDTKLVITPSAPI